MKRLFQIEKLKSVSVEKGAGTVVDVLNGPLPRGNGFGTLALFSVEPKGVRGNHYHTEKMERTFIFRGRTKLVCEDVKTKKRDEVILDSKDNPIVTIHTNVAHAYVNIGKENLVALFYGNHPFSPGEKTTVDYRVVPSKLKKKAS